ncbi:hypothetical protein Moror_2125, partial [Moniliophthora roreri MCA 2997]
MHLRYLIGHHANSVHAKDMYQVPDCPIDLSAMKHDEVSITSISDLHSSVAWQRTKDKSFKATADLEDLKHNPLLQNAIEKWLAKEKAVKDKYGFYSDEASDESLDHFEIAEAKDAYTYVLQCYLSIVTTESRKLFDVTNPSSGDRGIVRSSSMSTTPGAGKQAMPPGRSSSIMSMTSDHPSSSLLPCSLSLMSTSLDHLRLLMRSLFLMSMTSDMPQPPTVETNDEDPDLWIDFPSTQPTVASSLPPPSSNVSVPVPVNQVRDLTIGDAFEALNYGHPFIPLIDTSTNPCLAIVEKWFAGVAADNLWKQEICLYCFTNSKLDADTQNKDHQDHWAQHHLSCELKSHTDIFPAEHCPVCLSIIPILDPEDNNEQNNSVIGSRMYMHYEECYGHLVTNWELHSSASLLELPTHEMKHLGYSVLFASLHQVQRAMKRRHTLINSRFRIRRSLGVGFNASYTFTLSTCSWNIFLHTGTIMESSISVSSSALFPGVTMSARDKAYPSRSSFFISTTSMVMCSFNVTRITYTIPPAVKAFLKSLSIM